jgi:hypothetical protein
LSVDWLAPVFGILGCIQDVKKSFFVSSSQSARPKEGHKKLRGLNFSPWKKDATLQYYSSIHDRSIRDSNIIAIDADRFRNTNRISSITYGLWL